MENCIFCKIVEGEIPSWTIYEDKNVKAFLDTSPISRGHILVIPKEHYENIFDIPNDILDKVIKVSKKMALLLKENLKAEGVNLLNSNSKIAQQDVFHYHMHIIPRYSKDKLKIIFENPTEDKDFEEIKRNILKK